MAEQFSRRSFLKGGALTAGAFALGGFPRVDTAMAAPQKKAKVFFTKDISLEGLMKVYARVNQGMSGKIAIKLAYGRTAWSEYFTPRNSQGVPGEHSEQQHCGMQCFVSQSEADHGRTS